MNQNVVGAAAMDSDLMAVIGSDWMLSNDSDVGLSIKSDGATATNLTLLVAFDSARAEVGRLDVGSKNREAADSDGVPALDSIPSLVAMFDSDHAEGSKLVVVVATEAMATAARKAEAAMTMAATAATTATAVAAAAAAAASAAAAAAAAADSKAIAAVATVVVVAADVMTATAVEMYQEEAKEAELADHSKAEA